MRESRKKRDAQSTTLMLIVVIGVFLTTEIPLMVITALHMVHVMDLFASFQLNFSCRFNFMNYYVAKNIVLVSNAIICFSYPLNFAIYCGMSR
jgi:neuromedin U receptor 1